MAAGDSGIRRTIAIHKAAKALTIIEDHVVEVEAEAEAEAGERPLQG